MNSLIWMFCIIISLLTFFSCNGSKGPAEPENSPPSCSIITPADNVEYFRGDDINISIDANDSDGTVESVIIYIEDDIAATLLDPPFEYLWETSGYYIGDYLIRARAVDDDNASTWSSIDIELGYRYSIPPEEDDGYVTGNADNFAFDVDLLTDLMNNIASGIYTDLHSVLIYREGTLVFEEYFRGHVFDYTASDYKGSAVNYNRNTVQNTHSATKSVCSALIGIAIEQGYIGSVDERVSLYLTEFAAFFSGGKEEMTIRHFLTMSSGLQWNEMDVAVSNEQDVSIFNMSNDPIGYLLGKALLHAPGTTYYYNGGGVDLLGEILRIATGMNVDTFAGQNLFGPIGVSNYQFQTLYPSGIIATHGDIYIRPRDMMKFGVLFLNNGVWNGNRILSEEWVNSSWEDYIFPTTHSTLADGYGYLWWLQSYNVNSLVIESFSARGWGENEIHIFPEQDMVVVFSGSNYTGRYQPPEILRDYILPALIN